MRSRRAGKHRVAVTSVVLAAAVLALAPLPHPQFTRATWADSEYGTSDTLTAGTVSPPLNLSCGPTGLLQPVKYNWNTPSGGLARTGYRWTATGPGGSPSGTLGAGALTVTLSQGLLGIGSGTFTLYAQGPGTDPNTWESTPVTGHYSVIGILGLTALSSCSVP
jgi:hypothetical protein